jgi:hypothetical protein
MKTIVSLLFIAASPAISQNSDMVLIAAGPWQLCESAVPPQGLCNGFVPGNEQYILLIGTQNSAVLGYAYSVTGTLADGTVRTISGVTGRLDNPEGYTGVLVNLGGPVTNTSFTVEDLVATSTRKAAGLVMK